MKSSTMQTALKAVADLSIKSKFVIAAVMVTAGVLLPAPSASALVFTRSGSCWNGLRKHTVTVTWDVTNGISKAKSIYVYNSIPTSSSGVTAGVYIYQSQLAWSAYKATGKYTFYPTLGGPTSGGVWVRVYFDDNSTGGVTSRCNVDILDS